MSPNFNCTAVYNIQLYLVAYGGIACALNHINKIDAATKEAVQKLQSTKNGIDGISTGFERLDYIFGGLKDGDVYTIGGRPSMGKTSFAFSLFAYMCHQCRVVCSNFAYTTFLLLSL